MKVARFSALRTGRLYSPVRSAWMVLMYVWGWVDSRAIARPEGLCHWKIPMTPAGNKPATFWLIAQGLHQLVQRKKTYLLIQFCSLISLHTTLYLHYVTGSFPFLLSHFIILSSLFRSLQWELRLTDFVCLCSPNFKQVFLIHFIPVTFAQVNTSFKTTVSNTRNYLPHTSFSFHSLIS
jgi:hypothetical protein